MIHSAVLISMERRNTMRPYIPHCTTQRTTLAITCISITKHQAIEIATTNNAKTIHNTNHTTTNPYRYIESNMCRSFDEELSAILAEDSYASGYGEGFETLNLNGEEEVTEPAMLFK